MPDNVIQISTEADVSGIRAAMGEAADQVSAATAAMAEDFQGAATGSEEMKAGIAAASDGIRASMADAVSGVAESTASIRESLESVKASAEAARLPFEALSAVVEIGAVVEPINKLKESLLDLGHSSEATGVSVAALASLKMSLESLGVPTDNFGQTMARLAEHLMTARDGSKQEADAFEQLGLTTADLANKNLSVVDVMMKIADHLHSSSDATNDLASAYLVLGRGSDKMVAGLKEGSAALQQQMGSFHDAAEATQDSVQAAKDLQQVETQLEATLVPLLLPAFQALVPAIKGVASAFYFVVGGGQEVMDALESVFIGISLAAVDAGHAIHDAFTGNFKKAAIDSKAALSDLQAAMHEADVNMQQDAASAMQKIGELWATAPEAKPAHPAASHGSDETGKQQMARFERQLETEKSFHQMSAAEEASFWVQRLAMVAAGSENYDEILKRELSAAAEARKQADAAALKSATQYLADQGKAQQQATADVIKQNDLQIQANAAGIADMKKALDEYYAEQQKQIAADADYQLKQVSGLVSAKKIGWQEELSDVTAIYQREHDALVASLQAQVAALDQSDKNYLAEKQKLNNEINEANNKLNIQLLTANQKADREHMASAQKVADEIDRTFSEAFQGVIQGTQSLTQAFARMGQDMIATFAEAMERIVSSFVVNHLLMRQVGRDTAQAQINQDAAKAASGAYSATVGIPIIGPALAPIAAGVAWAGVEAFGSLASAEGGQWQVPFAEQLTMLHRNEMVLPAGHAEALRQTVAGGQSSGGGGDVHLHVHAVDSQSVQRLFDQNGRALARTLRTMARKGALA